MSFTGNYYAFNASGGFYLTQNFTAINVNSQTTLSEFDMTNSLQLNFDVHKFNEKLGLYKDTSYNIISTTYDASTNEFSTDTISFSSSEFTENIQLSNVISMGYLSSLYTDFYQYVKLYFLSGAGFISLYSGSYETDIPNVTFDASALMTVFHPQSNSSIDVSGTISLNNLNSCFRFVVDSNIFGNRDPSGNAGTSVSPLNNHNDYGVQDGFLAGDLIFIPGGITITLNVNISLENFAPTNNIGPTIAGSSTVTNGYFTSVSTATKNYIRQTVTVPMLLRLV